MRGMPWDTWWGENKAPSSGLLSRLVLPRHWDKCLLRDHWLTNGLLPHRFPSQSSGAQTLAPILPTRKCVYLVATSVSANSLLNHLASCSPWELGFLNGSHKKGEIHYLILFYSAIQPLYSTLAHCGPQCLNPAFTRIGHMWKWVLSFHAPFFSFLSFGAHGKTLSCGKDYSLILISQPCASSHAGQVPESRDLGPHNCSVPNSLLVPSLTELPLSASVSSSAKSFSKCFQVPCQSLLNQGPTVTPGGFFWALFVFSSLGWLPSLGPHSDLVTWHNPDSVSHQIQKRAFTLCSIWHLLLKSR